MKGQHFVVFAFGHEFCHMMNSPEVLVIVSDNYTSIYTSHHSYPNSKPVNYTKIKNELAEIIDNGGILVMKNTELYGLTIDWMGITKNNPSEMVDHIENHVIELDLELKRLTEQKLNYSDIDLNYSLHTEMYAPIWQKGSKDKIIQECISDANIILALIKRCSDAGDIKVRLRNEKTPMEFDVEW